MLTDKLPLEQWQETKVTLHLYLQIIGKIRMALHPPKHHWWHVTFYIDPRGITTRTIPYAGALFEMKFDLIDHCFIIETSKGETESFALYDQLSVAEFYQKVFSKLKKLGIEVSILTKPFDPSRVGSDIPFEQDNTHKSYDKDYVHRYWKILAALLPVFKKFNGEFIGKSTPVHLFWHTMDLALTRFSGRTAPSVEGMDPVSAESYSHEVISFGFWPGDSMIGEPCLYSYTHPEPKGLELQQLKPAKAFWHKVNGTHLALLKYNDLIENDDPQQALLDFLRSTFAAGSKLAKW